ncbi:MAG TPA: 30S ribosomal protein S6 [Gemmatimonadota bacterium]|nr:30S ribosomal protein S6 [Gemmatimonadota bacterium]
MRDYETVYIFRSTLEPEEIDGKLEKFHERLTGGEGEITAVEHWGKRQLAYPIDGQTNGYYVVAQYRTEPEHIKPFENALKMDEAVLRHLVVLSEGESALPPSQRGEEPEEDEDEDDRDDEDEED